MTDIVKIVPYNTAWPDLFEQEANLIRQVLGNNCIDVHHIGSTAVPGLSAKPIIDILPVVRDILKVDEVIQDMQKLGYVSLGEHGIPCRRFFHKGTNPRTHHVHIFEVGNPQIAKHIKFRDWMRQHDRDRESYEKLKINLAEKFSHDRLSYSLGKNAFIAEIDTKAGLA
jgi:GrpB-like predicted nucleotidyltransferase (UPF0157 family)